MKNIFLIVSSSLLANKVIPVLERDQDIRLTVLLHSAEARERITVDTDTQVMTVPRGQGYRLRSLRPFISQLEGVTFDEVIVLYNNKTGYGYVNVDLYALAVRARKRYAINYDHDKIPLSVGYIIRKILRAVTGLFWHIVNTMLLCFIFTFIIISMVIVEIVVWGRSILVKKEAPI